MGGKENKEEEKKVRKNGLLLRQASCLLYVLQT
jgi:hypothetical protein